MKKSQLYSVLVLLTIASMSSGCISSTSFQEWRGADEYVGEGGTFHTVDGIEIWENGSPDRRYKVLGVADVSTLSKAPCMVITGGFDSHVDNCLAKEAKKHGGDAVILVQAESSMFDSSHPQASPWVTTRERAVIVKYLESEPAELLGKKDYGDKFGKRRYAVQGTTATEQIHANCDLEIRELLAVERHVAFCISMSEPNNTCSLSQDRLENWKKAMTNEVGNFYENVVFSYFNKFENFTLVDRNNLINVLNEHQLSQSGLTNKETRIEVGKLVGINYLVNIGYNRYCLLPRVNDITTIKLIEIETGKIVAVDTIENWQIYNTKSLQLEIIKTVLNGQEVVMGPDGRTLYRK